MYTYSRFTFLCDASCWPVDQYIGGSKSAVYDIALALQVRVSAAGQQAGWLAGDDAERCALCTACPAAVPRVWPAGERLSLRRQHVRRLQGRHLRRESVREFFL